MDILTPSVRTALVTHNSGKKIKSILDSLLAQNYSNLYVTVHDNASTDQTINIIKQHPLKTQLILSNKNLGFARAVNLIIKQCKENFIFIVNDDIVLQNNYITTCIDTILKDTTIAGTTGLLYEVKNLNELTTNLRAIDHFYLSKFRKISTNPSYKKGISEGISCAAALFRKEALIKIADPNIFDEKFFMYFEDVDLSWRLYKMGYKLILSESTHAWHLRSYSFKKRYSIKPELRKLVYLNRYRAILKNEEKKNFLFHCPYFLSYEIIQFLFLIFFDFKLLTLYKDLINDLPLYLQKRKNKQTISLEVSKGLEL